MRYPKFLGMFMLAFVTSNYATAWELYGEGDELYLFGGSYIHFSSDDDYNGTPVVASLTVKKPDRNFYGLALFNNSFNQFSQYLYVGREYPLDNVYNGLRFNISAGVVSGYRGDHDDVLPFNEELGVGLVFVPGLSYQKGRWGVDAYLLAYSGLLFGIGYKF